MNDYTRLFDIIYYQQAQFPQHDAFCRKENGAWIKYSTDDIIRLGTQVSLSLLALGVKPDDKIAVVSANRPEWNIVDLGVLQIGAVLVPIYPTITEEEYEFILKDGNVKYIFVGDEGLAKKISNIKDKTELIDIYSFDKVAGTKHFATEFLELGKEGNKADVDTARAAVKPEQLATIIYTSGTTGNPKGVMLSHNNVVSNVKAVKPLLPLNSSMKILSFLPLCHIFERMVVYVYMANGISIYYAESLELIADNLKEVKPDFFTSVPRLLEKVYMKLEAASSNLDGIKKKIYVAAMDFAVNYDIHKQYGWWDNFLYKNVYDKLIFSKWREALGGNVKGIVTGAAKLNPKLARVFTAAGIMISEGYGQTESSPVITVNPFDRDLIKFGTVGKVIEGVDVHLDHREGMGEGEGEILAKGPNVMMGYYNRPDATAATVKDGWLYTGDVGKFIDFKGGKYLQITDRVKEIFKTSGGKYVAPLSLESKMKEIPFIEQMLVIGENRNYVSALIVPNFPALAEWGKKHGVTVTSNEALVKSPEVKKMMQAEIDEKNKSFGNWETIKRFELLPNEWTTETGELTPTTKVRRKVVMEKYADLIEGLYSGVKGV
ncbi:MAG: Long-chain fatty acid--CoA ligase [Bacteroidetes bacterium]|nr:Long-chain fatty acid--CoA ligase [Bacteroidota bacterium]